MSNFSFKSNPQKWNQSVTTIISMNKEMFTLLCESILAFICPSRISCMSSSSNSNTVVLNDAAILDMSADRYGLKY